MDTGVSGNFFNAAGSTPRPTPAKFFAVHNEAANVERYHNERPHRAGICRLHVHHLRHLRPSSRTRHGHRTNPGQAIRFDAPAPAHLPSQGSRPALASSLMHPTSRCEPANQSRRRLRPRRGRCHQRPHTVCIARVVTRRSSRFLAESKHPDGAQQ